MDESSRKFAQTTALSHFRLGEVSTANVHGIDYLLLMDTIEDT